MKRANLTESQNAHRAALQRIKSALRPLPLNCLCDACVKWTGQPAAPTLREVARLCMAEAARLEEEKNR